MSISAVDLAIDSAQLADIERRRRRGEASATDPAIEASARERLSDVETLAHLPPLEYDKIRGAAAKAQGIRTATLDAEVKKLRSAEDKAEARGVVFDEPNPWPEFVDGAELLETISKILRQFVIMPSAAYTACALWTLHSWVPNAARVSPILAIVSPEKRCGKTTLLEVEAALVRRALPASNITAAALFRAVEQFEPTLLIDEADTFLRNSDELRGVLNSGHRRRSAYVIRAVGDEHTPTQFRTWAPKAIALIGKLSPTLADRSITISLSRRGPGETVNRWRDESFHELRRKLTRWAVDNEAILAEARPELPEGLHDRALDNWEPLFAIGDAAGGKWPERARSAAHALTGDIDESAPTMLLADVRRIFDALTTDTIASGGLCESLAAIESRPWPEWRQGKPITPRQLARLLAPFGIVPGTKRLGSATFKGYSRTQFEDAWTRYLAPCVTTSQPTGSGSSRDKVSDTRREVVTDGKTLKSTSDKGCDGVTDRGSASRYATKESSEFAGFEDDL